MDDMVSAAARFINTTSRHIFLTGKAGTGKTTFLKNLGGLTHKSHLVVAPTGIAALNAGGVTIHSQFLIPPATFLPDRSLPADLSDRAQFINQNTLARKHPLNSVRKQVLRSIDLLVIDEVSMLRADLLDAIDYRMRSARGNFRRSFGGVQVLFIGDLYQLPPVVRRDDWNSLSQYYRSPWFYEAKALEGNTPIYIELDEIFRQSNPEFIRILNNLRNNICTREDILVLNERYRAEDEIRNLREIITLTTHNYRADELNQKELKNLEAPSRVFEAIIEGEFPESMYPVVARMELKVGAQVMFVRNDTVDKMYYNGKLAIVCEMNGNDVWVEMAGTHERYVLKRVRWENKKYSVNASTQDLEDELIGSYEQYPIKLAWAITVHKSQGLTFEKAIIDVGQAFADGQVYVALSRLRSLDGLVLRTRINPSVISTDGQVVAFSKANHRPAELGAVMKEHQQGFILELINDGFDFESIVKEMRYVLKSQAEDPDEELVESPLTSIAHAIESEQANTLKYRQQLAELIGAGDQTQFLERLEKGSAYYNNLLARHGRDLLLHTEITRQRKRVKTYLNQLQELDQVIEKKRIDVTRMRILIETILSGGDQFSLGDITKQRSTERMQVLAEIHEQVGSKPEKKKKKRSKKLSAGDERSTHDITLELLNAGKSIHEIAEERGLVDGTIEGHLAKAVGERRLSVFRFMKEDAVREIAEAIGDMPEAFSSRDLFAKLKGKFGYGQLRAVMNHLGAGDHTEMSKDL